MIFLRKILTLRIDNDHDLFIFNLNKNKLY